MNWSDIGDAMFGGLPDYAEILALVSNSVSYTHLTLPTKRIV